MKALLMWIQFSLESIDEILLFKCRMQSSENNIEILAKSDNIMKVDITYIRNYYQDYDDRVTLDLRNFYFNAENQMCWILIGGDFMRKISEASNNQRYLKFEFCCYTTTHNMKPEYKLFKTLNQTALGSVKSRNKDDPLKLLNIKDNLLLLCRRKLELFNKYKTL